MRKNSASRPACGTCLNTGTAPTWEKAANRWENTWSIPRCRVCVAEGRVLGIKRDDRARRLEERTP